MHQKTVYFRRPFFLVFISNAFSVYAKERRYEGERGNQNPCQNTYACREYENKEFQNGKEYLHSD